MGFVDVKDVVAIMIRLMNENRFNERYIASGENMSFREFYSHIAQSLHKPAPSIGLNKFTLKVFQQLYNLGNKKNKISSTMIEHATGQHIYSNKKVAEALKGYTFTPIKETLEQTAKLFLNEDTK